MRLKFAAVVLAASISTVPVVAEADGRPGGQQEPASDWSISLGALGMVKPEYEGSDDYDVTGFPIIDIRWRDRVFLNGRDGLGVDIWKDGVFTLSTSVGYTFGRDDSDSSDLAGLGDIDGGATAIVKGEARFGSYSLSARFSHQLTGEETGFLVDLGLGYSWRSQDGWFARPGLSASYASGQYMDEYFGVSAGQSATSGLAVYDADAGFKTVGAGVLAGYRFSENWSATGLVSYDRLVADAADSPVTRDRDQFSLGLGVARQF